ncbi:hypothetical protein [Nisaea sp.]|uniref:hypothetical protein n=1 Tax=Nisaea sp. TaxID=2024842 RepID=UPI003265C86E
MPTKSDTPTSSKGSTSHRDKRPTKAQISWLARGLDEPGGKLPLFTTEGQRVNDRMVKSCLDHGWAEPWFENPLKPNWLVCKITDQGRAVLNRKSAI